MIMTVEQMCIFLDLVAAVEEHIKETTKWTPAVEWTTLKENSVKVELTYPDLEPSYCLLINNTFVRLYQYEDSGPFSPNGQTLATYDLASPQSLESLSTQLVEICSSRQ